MLAYCVKCRAKKELVGAKQVKLKGKGERVIKALKGKCTTCATPLYKILGQKQ